MTRRKKIWIGSTLIFLVVWGIWVWRMNVQAREVDEIPKEYYQVGEYVTFEHNNCYGNYHDGYSMRVNNHEIQDIDEFLNDYELKKEDFDFLPGKVCLVHITLKYDEASIIEDYEPTEWDRAVYFPDFYLVGEDFYATQYTELFIAANPKLKGSCGVYLLDGHEIDVTLVFTFVRTSFTRYSWEHMDKLKMMLQLTGRPVRKYVIFQ